VTISSLAPPSLTSRPNSRPDFTRGFGLDIPEEDEPEGNTSRIQDDTIETEAQDGLTTVAHSRHHSRHLSHLSAALSLRSVGGTAAGAPNEREDPCSPIRNSDDLGQDGAEEWTGSEDLHDITEDDEVFDSSILCMSIS
jgi:hypothetical protein